MVFAEVSDALVCKRFDSSCMYTSRLQVGLCCIATVVPTISRSQCLFPNSSIFTSDIKTTLFQSFTASLYLSNFSGTCCRAPGGRHFSTIGDTRVKTKIIDRLSLKGVLYVETRVRKTDTALFRRNGGECIPRIETRSKLL